MEINPCAVKKFIRSMSLKKEKNDMLDTVNIAKYIVIDNYESKKIPNL